MIAIIQSKIYPAASLYLTTIDLYHSSVSIYLSLNSSKFCFFPVTSKSINFYKNFISPKSDFLAVSQSSSIPKRQQTANKTIYIKNGGLL